MKAMISKMKNGLIVNATEIVSEEEKQRLIKELSNFPIKSPLEELCEKNNKKVVPSFYIVEHDFDNIAIY